MKGLLIAVVTAALVVGAVYLFNSSNEPGGVPPGEAVPAAVGEPGQAPPTPEGSLRERVLHSTAQQLGLTPVRGVWGVLMERGYEKGTATIVALTDGTANLYLSTGGVVAGGNSFAPARAAALKLCERAADSLGETAATRDFSAPAKGHIRFLVLTTDGVRLAESNLFAQGKDAGADRLAPLLAAGDALLDTLKEATSKGYIR